MATLVDSNVILDIVTDDEKWGDWSASRLADAAREGRLVINPLIYAEVFCGFERIEAWKRPCRPNTSSASRCPGRRRFLPRALVARALAAALYADDARVGAGGHPLTVTRAHLSAESEGAERARAGRRNRAERNVTSSSAPQQKASQGKTHGRASCQAQRT
jgi:hypothetical protein